MNEPVELPQSRRPSLWVTIVTSVAIITTMIGFSFLGAYSRSGPTKGELEQVFLEADRFAFKFSLDEEFVCNQRLERVDCSGIRKNVPVVWTCGWNTSLKLPQCTWARE